MRFEYADARMPMAMTKGGVTYYLTYDQVGSLRVVADASGNVIKRIDCDSFGSIINDTNPGFHVPFGFAGGLHDRDTGLVRFGFRDYDPDTGRWTAKDPILFKGRQADLYGYVQNNPVNWVDPDGRGPILFRICLALAAADAGYTIYELDKYAKEQEEISKKIDETVKGCKTTEDLLKRWDEIEELKKQGIKAAYNITKARIWGYVSGGAIAVFCGISLLPVLP
jgi:RHS repeat-associated protein